MSTPSIESVTYKTPNPNRFVYGKVNSFQFNGNNLQGVSLDNLVGSIMQGPNKKTVQWESVSTTGSTQTTLSVQGKPINPNIPTKNSFTDDGGDVTPTISNGGTVSPTVPADYGP